MLGLFLWLIANKKFIKGGNMNIKSTNENDSYKHEVQHNLKNYNKIIYSITAIAICILSIVIIFRTTPYFYTPQIITRQYLYYPTIATDLPDDFKKQMNQQFKEIIDFHNNFYKWFSKFIQPHDFSFNNHVNIINNDNEYSITVSIPGFDKEQISLEIRGNTLIIYAENKDSTNHQKFKNIIQIPSDTNSNGIKSKLLNGILTITIPRITPKTQSITIGSVLGVPVSSVWLRTI